METERLAHDGQKTGQKHRPVATARYGDAPASDSLALAARSCRSCAKRARRPARAPSDRGDQGSGPNAKSKTLPLKRGGHPLHEWRAPTPTGSRSLSSGRTTSGRTRWLDLSRTGETSERLQNIIGAGNLRLTRRVLDVEGLHHAVLDQHG